ncbi:MAG: GAF domain-containing sensor histidine kinase, partial [Eggerthellaceae bacterium]|nr:GAF domain-containing sensor histidine kinase [Eggerthellaceae bacterium]
RIMLSPGHGVGGVVLKSGRAMISTDIDLQLDPRQYSSYPIVFAEDLHSFCALPLFENGTVRGVLLCAFRSVSPAYADVFDALIASLADGICGFSVGSAEPLNFAALNASGSMEDGGDAVDDITLMQMHRAQEQERRRISRRLHDEIGQELLSVSMMIRQIPFASSPDAVKDLADQATAELAGCMRDLKNLSVELRPLALDDLGLGPALRTQANLYRDTYGPRIEVDDNTGGARFPKLVETHAYRIAQEAMLNACRYSGSDTVNVAIDRNAGQLEVIVYDQGCGFDAQQPQIQGHGSGLQGMRERASIIGGRLTVRSNEDGTTVLLKVPLANEEGSRA